MVAQRRLGPLVALVGVGLVVLIARLFQVQVGEHEVWAAQAASFVRNAHVVPYHRGRFLDNKGRVLVADEDAYQLEFAYRDFRRSHPLALVAHARSALEMRPVPLVEAETALEAWAVGIATLSPAHLTAFAHGEALVAANGQVLAPPCADPETERRADRAQDLRFYALKLLAATSAESGRLRKLAEKGAADLSYLELLARDRHESVDDLERDVARRVSEARDDLAVLAAGIERDAAIRLGDGPGDATERLLALLDVRRDDQEDDAADELFRLASGFAPGRVPTDVLRATFDLAWIGRSLRWDAPRLERWIASRRRGWEVARDEVILPRILARADVQIEERDRAHALLDGLAALYDADGGGREPRSWTVLADLTVLREASTLFEGRPLERAEKTPKALFSLQDEDVRLLDDPNADPWLTVGRVFEFQSLASGLASTRADEISARWKALSHSRAGLDGDEALEQLRTSVLAFEARFAGECERVFGVLRGSSGPLALSGERLDRAHSRERYVLVDVQSRAVRLHGDPSYELVELVARDPARYAGFSVREVTRRVEYVHDEAGSACAGLLIGDVRRPMLRELMAQSEDQRRLASLQYKVLRSEEDERELKELATRLARADEWTGDRGLESYFDRELRGKFGFYETEGLADEARGSDPARVVPAVDGADVVLTIDADLQDAAQDVLAHPELPPAGQETDRTWFANPVGAIVLLTPDGEVLAAASVPTVDGLPATPGRGQERSHARERTLSTPTFNPPGSVYKPFVAAYAIDRLGFDPNTRYPCMPREKDGSPGFESLRCAELHVTSDMHRAIAVSCNAYFAQLGLQFTSEQFLDMAAMFGFGEPTGIACFGTEGRGGLHEDWHLVPHMTREQILKKIDLRADHLRFPCGLGTMWSSPMQVARAFAGLATGDLPDIRIARTIAGAPVARHSRPIPISPAALDFVRTAMHAVVNEVGGSGHGKRLDEASLGFTFACKTGSADIGRIVDVEGLGDEDRADMAAGKARKHTWVAGWFPADEPKAILVVYLHNMTGTSGHTAVWVAGQFMRTPAVKRFVAGDGAR